MGKKTKESKIGLKTARYFTKDCGNCAQSYPNWFTHCPKCGFEWSAKSILAGDEAEDLDKKTIKILVKITEEDFNEEIDHIQLIFSGDQGKSWYQMKMDVEADYFIAEMIDVPNNSVIIYYMEVFLANGDNFIENNEGKYFYYKVGVPMGEIEEEPPQLTAKALQDNLTFSIPNALTAEAQSEYDTESEISNKSEGQTDPNLKICPHCSSKIKKKWNTCPFCGKNV